MRKYTLGLILCLTLGIAYSIIGNRGTATATPSQPLAAQTDKSSNMVCQADAPAGAPEPVPCNNTEEIWCDGNTLVRCGRTPNGYFIMRVQECGDGLKCAKIGEGVYGCVAK